MSLVINLGFLGFFKYFNFFVDSFAACRCSASVCTRHRCRFCNPASAGNLVLHVPGSRLHRRRVPRQLKPAESLIDYALFISLFPHLIAGPIQRPSHLLPQVQRPREFDGDEFFDGLMLILIGAVPQMRGRRQLRAAGRRRLLGRIGPTTVCRSC